MTDLISDLLHADADRVAVPPAPAAAVIAKGRRIRTRARLARGGVVAAGVAALAATAVILPRDRAPEDYGPLAPAVAPDPAGWAVAQGSTVHLGSGATVEVPGKVKAMYYTSAGVMVRTGRTAYTEGDSTSNYFVLENDGDVRDYSLDLGDKKPGTDPSLPYLAYSEGDGSEWDLILRDVRTGEVATRVPYEGDFTWGGWNAPPTALSGDFAYVGVDDATLRINWRTGDVEKAAGLSAGRMPTVAGGRELVEHRTQFEDGPIDETKVVTETHEVLDATTGRVLREFDVTGTILTLTGPNLSSDGGHVSIAPWLSCNDRDDTCRYDRPTIEVVSVGTGARRDFRVADGTFGWTPDGRLLLVRETEVRSCDADTGECTSTPVELTGSGPIRVSGNDNES